MSDIENTEIWSFKYEPQTLEEMVLNEEIKPKLEKAMITAPNLILYGSAGQGKGTFTKIFIKENDVDSLWLNASLQNSINDIRGVVHDFAYTGSKKIKLVVFNEASALSSGKSSAQEALKDLIEDTQKICRYFFLTNHISEITPELQSRCPTIKFDNPPIKEIVLLGGKILKKENVEYDPKMLIEIVKKCYPDIRKTIWSIQENVFNKKLVGTSIFASEEVYKNILKNMKKKDVNEIRKTIKSNYIEYPQLYSYLFENINEFNSVGDAIIEIGDHLKDNYFMPNDSAKEINFMRMVCKMIKGRLL